MMIDQQILDQIQPIVLVGGQSKRFGRDKLIEHIEGFPLVSGPINTLRTVFGPRVAIVGQCDPRIASLADQVIEDPYPGLGPVGGICAALESTNSDIFVCAGDLISIDTTTIHAIIQASIQNTHTHAYLATNTRLHPTLGLYRSICTAAFKSAIESNLLKLGMVLDHESIRHVPVADEAVRNINHLSDL
jgi:molybdopterin-guanine dinucleotide biosynthesis protein A